MKWMKVQKSRQTWWVVSAGFAAISSFLPGVATAAPGDCSLTPGAGGTYQVTSQADLQILVTDANCRDESLVQTADIALTVSPWVPISNFTGSYDGRGYSIGGLVLSGNNAGLFNVGNAGATFSNLVVTVANSTNGGSRVGALVGESSGSLTIVDVDVSGDVTGSASYVGGLIGFMFGSVLTVTESRVEGNVAGQKNVGGLVGNVHNSTMLLEENSVVGDVTALVVANQPTTGMYVGGLAGYFSANGTTNVRNNRYTGDVAGTSYVGGLIGYHTGGSITVEDNAITGNVTGTAHPNDNNTGHNVGGVLGERAASSPTHVLSTRFVGNVFGHMAVGGLLGGVRNGSVSIVGASVEGDVTGAVTGPARNGSGVGGLVGEIDGSLPSSIELSHVIGDVSGSEDIGGLVGYLPLSNTSVSTTFVRGSVTGTAGQAGGMIGFSYAVLTFDSSFVLGSVSAVNFVGGFGGYVTNNINVEDSYFQGTVSGGVTKGSFLGRTGNSANIVFDKAFCTDVLCPIAQKITTDELKSADHLESRGWDLQNVWCVRSDLNDGFPVLRAITTGLLDATRCRPNIVPIWRVSLDPAGGECRDGAGQFTAKTLLVFVAYRYLPATDDCMRSGFSFEGWADEATPSVVAKIPLLVDPIDGKKRYFIATNADLVAVWKELDPDDLTGTAPGAFVGGPDRRTREGGGVVDGYYIPPNTVFGGWMLAK